MKIKRKKKKIGYSCVEEKSNYWLRYIIPALLFYVLFMAYPLLDSLRLSLYTGNTINTRTFVGFKNFAVLFTDSQKSIRFWSAFGNTWIFFFINIVMIVCLGLLFAVILTNRTMKGRQIYQTIIFIPTTFAVLVTGYLWKLLLNPVWSGPALTNMGLGFLARPYLGQSSTALISCTLVSCWQWMGIPTMMFVAALRNVSEDCIEAAEIEGANSRQLFARVKLPLIKPTIGMVTILTFVGNFNAFDIIFAMENANGAPEYSTDLIGTLFYRIGIAGQHPIGIPDAGLGAAIATVIFFVLVLAVIPTLKLTQGGDN